jgi:hypothetical protein
MAPLYQFCDSRYLKTVSSEASPMVPSHGSPELECKKSKNLPTLLNLAMDECEIAANIGSRR